MPLPANVFQARERRRVVGTVAEDDSTVQVVYRLVMAGEPPRFELDRLAIATVRQTPEGWRLWNGSQDYVFLGQNGFFSSLGLDVEGKQEQRVARARGRVVAWPTGEVPAGRAFVAGYPGGLRPPRALVVEVPGREGGAPTRVEVPFSAFEELMEQLLMPWTGLEEPKEPPAQP